MIIMLKTKEKEIKAKDKTTKEVKKADKSLDDHNKKLMKRIKSER